MSAFGCETIVRKLGGRWDMQQANGMCRCPAHDDHTPSLSVSERDGSVLVHCHAGCPQDDVLGALAAQGMDIRRSDGVNGASQIDDYCHPKLGKPSRTWPYFDAKRNLVGYAARFETKDGKTFRPLVLKGGRWRAEGIPTPRPLFNLPSIISKPDAPVLICEGEKAAEAAANLFPDVVTTTAVHGAKSPGKSDWAPLKARSVSIWPDNDEAGANYAAEVAGLAKAAGAASVRIVRLPGNLPKGWDLADDPPAGLDLGKLLAEATKNEASSDAKDEDHDEFSRAVTRLAALLAHEYDRKRKKEAKRLNVRIATLDDAVNAARTATRGDNGLQGQVLEWAEPEPWPKPVDGAVLLDDLAALARHFVVLPPGGAEAVALWVLYCWTFDSFSVSPGLMVTAPERNSGKSRVMDLLTWLVPRPKPISDASAAAIIRGIESDHPTLLFDEAQHFLRRPPGDPMRGILLASFSRRFASVERCEGDSNEVRTFSTFTPKAMNGRNLADVDDMLTSRCVVIPMRRATCRMPELRDDRDPAGEDKRSRYARWAVDHAAALREADPDMGDRINRSAQVWRPLFAIADAAGADWPVKARKVADELSVATEAVVNSETLGSMLLADVRAVFRDMGDPERLASQDLDAALIELPERPWASMGQSGKPLTSQRRGQLLKPFGIAARTIRSGNGTAKGYLRESFEAAWNAYLSSDPCSQTVTSSHLNVHGGFGDSQTVTSELDVTVSKFPKPPVSGACDGVTVSESGKAAAKDFLGDTGPSQTGFSPGGVPDGCWEDGLA